MAGRTPIESNFRIDNLTLNGAVNTTDWSEIIGNNIGSGVTWIPDYGTILVAFNGTDVLYEFALSDLNTVIRIITLSGDFSDSEDVCWMGNDEIAVCYEDASGYILKIINYVTGTTNTTWGPKQVLTIHDASADNNSGAEGVCYDQANQVFYVVGEGEQAQTDRQFFKVTRPANTTTDYTHTDSELLVEENWDAQVLLNSYGVSGFAFDFSSIDFHAPTGDVVIMSHQAELLLQINPATGNVVAEYDLPTGQQWEGIAFINTDNDMIATAELGNYQLLDAG